MERLCVWVGWNLQDGTISQGVRGVRMRVWSPRNKEKGEKRDRDLVPWGGPR